MFVICFILSSTFLLELDKLSREDAYDAIKRGQDFLRNNIGSDANYLCYPVGKYNDETIEIKGTIGTKTIEEDGVEKEINVLIPINPIIIDNKTIGIIICKKDNKFIMEYCSDSRILSRFYEIK